MILQRLNPADHFTMVMDREIRSSGLAGNFCGLVLELEHLPDRDYIEKRCELFTKCFPRSVARIGTAGKRYAWFSSQKQKIPIFNYKSDSVDHKQLLLNIINHSESISEAPPFSLHLIDGGKHSCLMIRWFHPAIDAKGIELLLHHLFGLDEPTLPATQESPIDTLLASWSFWKKCRLFFRGVQNVKKIDRQSSILPNENTGQATNTSIIRVTYDIEKSTRIMQQAQKNTSMTGISLYFIGCLMRAIELTGSSKEGESYCVPYAVNLRKSKAMHPVFGNQVSFMFARCNREIIQSRELLFKHLLKQRKQDIQLDSKNAMLSLLLAGSWLSLEKNGKTVRKSPTGRERSSFWFSFTGDMDPEPSEIGGCRVTDMYYLSQITAPPSLGLLVNRFQGRLNLSYNISENHISSSWMDRLCSNMSSELLGDAPQQ